MTMGSFNLHDLSWLAIADTLLKATLVLGAAALTSALLRRRSAAARHLVWTLALLAALALPALTLAIPRWQVPLLTIATETVPASLEATPAIAAPITQPRRTPVDNTRPADKTSSTAQQARAASVQTAKFAIARPDLSWQMLLLILWMAGTLAVLTRIALGVIAVQWLARRTKPAEDAPWIRLACKLANEVGVSSRLRFLRSARATMPMACGILRPSIVMPADADTWPAERLRIVLLHELAHVKRRDCLTHVLAQIACALYWFNPLAWVAARHVRTERERACDDLVLATGTRGADYADQLLEIARVMRGGRFPAVLAGASLAMAYRSQLEGRLMAILDPKVPRSGVSWIRAAAATAVAAVAILPLASVQPWAFAEASNVADARPQQAVAPAQEPQAQLPRPAPTPAPLQPTQKAVSVREQGLVESVVQGTTQAVVQAMTQGVTQGITQGVRQGAGQGWTRTTRQQFAATWPEVDLDIDVEQDETAKSGEGARAKGADAKTIAALKEALKDTDKEVRETALHALIQLRDPSIFDALAEALRDGAADVREQAAFGLGQLRDRRAVAPLTAALKDAVADVREQAVFALGQLRDPAAVEALTTAARDTNAEVRQQAVFALGQMRDRRAVEPLISALKDSDTEVREQAAFALGQVRDRAAVEALVIALKDSSASVREQAAFALGQLRDPRAIDGLTAALKDASADVRQQAAFALGQIAQ